MAISESFLSPVAVDLFNTRQCHALDAQINDFENAVFGPDFYCAYEAVRPWAESGSLFCAAVCGEAVAGRRKVFSVASVLITTEASRDRLFHGQIADYELCPWSLAPDRSRPAAYLASIISDNAEHLRAMYASLGVDLEEWLTAHGLEVAAGFSIAAGPAGMRHMARSGFGVVPEARYLGKYEFMDIERDTAQAQFWQHLLRARDGSSGEAIPPHGRGAGDLAAGAVPALDEAHQLERRLALSKAARYRQLSERRD